MSLSVFYSWQSDSPKETNRNFIESVLKKVIAQLGEDVELQESLRDEEIILDKDTQGVPGTPPIVDTILNKISNCSVFVPDLTFVGHTATGRPIPNPNVLIEYGWALKVLGHPSIVPVMNTAFGEPNADTLPFDMRHLRHPVTYQLQPDDDPGTKAIVKKDLADQMTEYLKLALTARRVSLASVTPFVGAPSTENPSAFWGKEETFARAGRFTGENERLLLPTPQRLFLRLVPLVPLNTIRSSKMAVDLVRSGRLYPMTDGSPGGISHGRNRHGGFCYDAYEGKILYLSQLFMTGELWGVDAATIEPEYGKQASRTNFAYFPIGLVERVFAFTLTNYLKFARETLGLRPPLCLRAGATDVRGYRMAIRHGFDGSVVGDHIEYEGTIDNLDGEATVLLRPFFDYFWEECGLERPDVPIYK